MKRICPTCRTVFDDGDALCPKDLNLTEPLDNHPVGAPPAPPTTEEQSAEAAGLTVRLAGLTVAVPPAPGLFIGRDPSSPFAAVLAGLGWTNVSNLHCVIQLLGPGQAEVMDLDSSNGTFIDQRRVPGNTPQPLRPGDSLRLAMDREVELQWS